MSHVEILDTRCVIVGSGVAGLSAALGHGDCVVVSKTTLGDGSSRWAQGGVAAALGDDDDPRVHAADTHTVSAGLDIAAVTDLVTGAAPDRIRWLESLGADFDRRADGTLALGREAGHTRHRIVHANGDATGAEVMRTLVAAVRARPDISTIDRTFVLDVLMADGRAVGIVAVNDGGIVVIRSPAVVLATGGVGRLYQHTTNPHEVTADGLAMAFRAGAVIRDPEFVQFHPTALASTLDPMPLLTEALRGEGAVLLDSDGHRFMLDAHDDAELAPRDIVARQIWRARRHGEVYLDARVIGPDFPSRFPTVWGIAQRVGLDPRVDLLPVSPAEHYHIGGIATDLQGRTSRHGLFAAGEAASTGLHGANRLASNSLLEGLVFGARVAQTAATAEPLPAAAAVQVPVDLVDVGPTRSDDTADIDELRRLMWDDVGLVRDETGLRRAADRIAALTPLLARDPVGRNLAAAALLIVDGALARTESRGSHHRQDHDRAAGEAVHSALHDDLGDHLTVSVPDLGHIGRHASIA